MMATCLLIGHNRPSLTYGHYSQGEGLGKDLREYIGRRRYSNEVMTLIRAGWSARDQRRRGDARGACD
jgi:hypothetical protein